ncbi:MAG TPA: aspartate aminotransferase family protein [Bacteroidia bacterium]|nr:aspartate aminotransferase family protein [Bacteroidia bacterium]
MRSNRQVFLEHLAQTSHEPLAVEITAASGAVLYGPDGTSYLDLISGIAVSNLGHCHPDVVEAVQRQAEKFMHVMVYGELIQAPQNDLAAELTSLLPASLNCCYFVNSGSEAIEGAMKLAKRATGRTEIISFHKAYHGSTQGALSIMGDEFFKTAYRPLLPDTRQISYGSVADLAFITQKTACVIVEPVQGEAGAVLPPEGYLKLLASKCKDVGALLIADEIQTAFRRTGPMFASLSAGIIPDVLVLAKSMGGGMPIGSFIADKKLMGVFAENPVLGHITTFGGHPVSCAAALAALKVTRHIPESEIVRKGELFRERLVHPAVKEITGKGLMLGVKLESETLNRELIRRCMLRGVFTDWFLFAPDKLRIAPPLIIDDHQIFMACEVILQVLDELSQKQ